MVEIIIRKSSVWVHWFNNSCHIWREKILEIMAHFIILQSLMTLDKVISIFWLNISLTAWDVIWSLLTRLKLSKNTSIRLKHLCLSAFVFGTHFDWHWCYWWVIYGILAPQFRREYLPWNIIKIVWIIAIMLC